MNRTAEGVDVPVASVLVVCTANVCRSPLAARLLAAELGPGVPVVSAGTRAVAGIGECDRSRRYGGAEGAAHDAVRLEAAHDAVRLEAAHVRAADLVLGAAREHRSAAVALVPAAQARAYTLLQAARSAAWLSSQGVRAPAALDPADRVRWWVEEFDAARGSAPLRDLADDDLPDPHEGGVGHDDVLPRIADAAAVLGAVLRGELGRRRQLRRLGA